ncbi:MAG: hypothetical protein J7M12_01915 [Candidatus Hydrogenedentes bacterium]|nr:hypothetical protein [Candidatus Hydrogenedentota bacterium]
MAEFTDESAVRVKTQLTDTVHAPTELIETSITDAHNALLERLDPRYADAVPVEAELIRGETLLAGAYLLRSVAAGASVRARDLRLGDRYIEEGNRYAAMSRMADRFEKEAWETVSRFLVPLAGGFGAAATRTEPILGED